MGTAIALSYTYWAMGHNKTQIYEILEYNFDLIKSKRFLDIKLKTVLGWFWNAVTTKPNYTRQSPSHFISNSSINSIYDGDRQKTVFLFSIH